VTRELRKYEAQLKKNMSAEFPWAVEVSRRYGGKDVDGYKGVLSEVKLYNNSYNFSGFIAHIGRYYGTSKFLQTDEIQMKQMKYVDLSF
jgi:hypothetical protein